MVGRKLSLLLILCTLAGAGTLYAGIGENFAKAGITLYGSVGGYMYFGPLDHPWLEDWSISAYPGISVFIADNLDLYVSPGFYYDNHSAPWGESSWAVSLSAGFDYFFLKHREAKKGIVPTIGVGVGVEFDSYYGLDAAINPSFRLLYFVTERIAPYFLLSPWVTTDFEWYYNAHLRFQVGMSFFFPSKDFVLRRAEGS